MENAEGKLNAAPLASNGSGVSACRRFMVAFFSHSGTMRRLLSVDACQILQCLRRLRASQHTADRMDMQSNVVMKW